MSKGDTRLRKEAYFTKLYENLGQFSSILICNVDNVGSNQMHQIRASLRGKAVIQMGKNTMVRRALRTLMEDSPLYENLLPIVRGNIGFVFTNGDLKEIRESITSNRVQAPARAGALAPCDVIVPAGNTGMEPGKTNFFQALGVPTKISRGTIEIINDVHLVKAGTRVGTSETTLLNMLNISPFTYGLSVLSVFDVGAVFAPSLLDISDEYLLERFSSGIADVASLSLAIGFPTIASVPHLIVNAYKDLVGVSLASDYCIEQVKELKELLENPEALAAAQAAAAATTAAAPVAGAAGAAKQDAPAAKEEKEEEESDDDMGFGLFD